MVQVVEQVVVAGETGQGRQVEQVVNHFSQWQVQVVVAGRCGSGSGPEWWWWLFQCRQAAPPRQAEQAVAGGS